MMKTIIKILVADDHPAFRLGVNSWIAREHDMEVIGETGDGIKLTTMIGILKPDILLLDLIMPHSKPVEILEWINKNRLCTKVLILTSHDADAYLAEMMKLGAAGYIDKADIKEDLISNIRRAADGNSVFKPEQIQRERFWSDTIGWKLEQLTSRELQILHLIANGLSNQEIALELGFTSKTAKFHVGNILSKLDVNSRQKAALWAVQHLRDL